MFLVKKARVCQYDQANFHLDDYKEIYFMNKLIHIILALLLPPVAVFLKSGVGKDLLINIILCLCFYVPGILHALWLITKD
jgi:uncharacterized membrane protein YqaE (UPF0057 family)